MKKPEKLELLERRLLAVDCLRIAKSEFTYERLMKDLGLSPPVLSRYVRGKVLPDPHRAEMLIDVFERELLRDVVRRRLSVDKEGLLDLSKLRADVLFMRVIGRLVADRFVGVIDKVICLDDGAEVLGAMTAWALKVPLIVVRREKEMGVRRFLEYRFVRSPSIVEYLYVPKGSIGSGEKLLAVFEVIRSGRSAIGLAGMAEKARAKVGGIASVVALKEGVEAVRKELGRPVKTFFVL